MTTGSREIGIDLDVHRTIERARISLGESANDILRRLLRPRRGVQTRLGSATPGRARAQPRRRGLWTVEIGGRKIPAANLKHAYRTLLGELAASHPHFLEEFGAERARGRCLVARKPEALFARSPHLAGRHAEPLAPGWYFDSNVSAEQVGKRARIAARLCGLHYGSDVRILDNLREI